MCDNYRGLHTLASDRSGSVLQVINDYFLPASDFSDDIGRSVGDVTQTDNRISFCHEVVVRRRC